MKKIKIIMAWIIMSLALSFQTYAQSARITYPIDGQILQQNPNSTILIDIVFQLDYFSLTNELSMCQNYSYIYKIEQIDIQTGNIITSTPRNWTTLSSSQWSLGSIDFKGFKENISLAKGWYKITLGTYCNNPGGDGSVNYVPLTSTKFGVGDIYFVAGQSNASGFDYNNFDNTQNYKSDYSVNNKDAVRMIKFKHTGNNNKTYDGDGNGNANQNQRMIGLPFNNTSFNNDQVNIQPFLPGVYDRSFAYKNLKNGNLTDMERIYPRGAGSWYWAYFADKISGNDTPVLIMNYAVPNTSTSEWQSNTDQGIRFSKGLRLHGYQNGVKSILWHQGEADIFNMRNITDATIRSTQLDNFKTNLNAIISNSRTNIGNANLPWFISKISFVSLWTTTPINPDITYSSLSSSCLGTISFNINTEFNGIKTKKLTSELFKTKQQEVINFGPKRFLGVEADDIDECQRADGSRIHFTGTNNTFDIMGERWKTAVNANYANANPILGKNLVPIIVTNQVNNQVKLEVVGSYPAYYWVKNAGSPYETADVISNANNILISNNTENSSTMYVCYVSNSTIINNAQLIATMPYVNRNLEDFSKSLDRDQANIGFLNNSNSKTFEVSSKNVIWDITNLPSWVSGISQTKGGYGSTFVTITVQPNTSTSSRSQTINLKRFGSSNDYLKDIILTQSGSSPPSGTEVNLINLPISSSYGARYVDIAVNGGGFLIGGKPFSNGFGVHAPNGIIYNLNGQYSNFSGKVGRDDSVDPNTGSNTVGQVQFKIKANGSVVWTSIVHNSITSAECLNVPLAGVNTLELITEIVENDYFDHGDWVDLKLNSPLYPVSCTTCQNNSATNTGANPASLSSSGGSSTLSATCPPNTSYLWETNQTSSTITINTTVSTSYWVKCVGNNCTASNPITINVNVTPPNGCTNLGNGTIAGNWKPGNTNFDLVVRDFNGSKWLTQRIGTNPDAFLVRGHNMIYRSDITNVNASVSSQPGCFSWGTSAFGGLLPPPDPDSFQAPSGYSLNWECTSDTSPCTSSNGTPIYIAGGTPPPPPPTSGCAGTFYLNNSWTYAGGVTTTPVVGGNTVGGNMIMGGVNYTSQYPGKGLGIHANSEVVYDLGANHGFTTFKATVGKDDGNFCSASWAGQEKITFKLVNNATGVDISSVTVGNPNTGISQTANFEVPITGVRYIKLVASDGGDGNYCDWANWANARVVCSPSSRTGSKEEEQEEAEESVLVLPNPNNGNFESLIMLNSASSLELSLVNNLGQVFETKKVNGVIGANKVHFKVSNLAKGLYTLRVQTDTKVLTSKVVIE
jgi:NPCBM/NEW2 domain/Secretion system C-terminal sorting domain/Carbohydrate esterase, sialic acid-specific acetylesterase